MQVAVAGAALLGIVIAPHADPQLHAEVLGVANELRDKLNAIVSGGSGTPFAAVQVSSTPTGIALGVHGDFAGVGWPFQGYFRPNDVLAGGVASPDRLALREQYVLSTPAATNRVIVAGATVAGLRAAVWDLLARAGYRHYFQTSNWEIVPHNPSLAFDALAVEEKPAFYARNLAFQRSSRAWDVADRDSSSAEQQAWCRHNRLGGKQDSLNGCWAVDLDPPTDYADIMDWWANRHSVAFPNALTTGTSGNLHSRQFCLSSTVTVAGQAWTALDVVAEWASLQTGAVLAVSPNTNISWTSATSGSGLHCNDVNHPTYAARANRILALANAAAAAQPTKVINARVLGGAGTPTLAARQNVFVILEQTYSPEGTFGLERRITEWSALAKDVGIADYLAAFGADLPHPEVATMAGLLDRIRHYHSAGLRQYTADVNTGWGVAGPAPWALAKSLWDADAPQSLSALRQDFLVNAFGSAAPAADKFYKVLESRPRWSETVIGELYRSLQEAFAANAGAGVDSRLSDLAKYTRYLELYRKFWNRCSAQSPVTEQLEQKELLRFLYTIRDSRLLRSRDLVDSIQNELPNCPVQPAGAACNVPEWGADCPSSTPSHGCGSCTSGTTCNDAKGGAPLTLTDVKALVDAGVANNSILNPALSRPFSKDLVPYIPSSPIAPQLPARLSTMHTIGSSYLYLQRASGLGSLSAHIKKFAAGNMVLGQLSAHPSRTLIESKLFPPGLLETDWTFSTSSSGVYRLDVDDQNGSIYTSALPSGTRLAIPAGVDDPPLAFVDRWNGYFFVPSGTQQVVGWSQADGQYFRYRKTGPTTWQTTSGYLSDRAVGHACTVPRIAINTTLGKSLDDHFVIPVDPPATTDEVWQFTDGSNGAAGERLLLSVPPYLYQSPEGLLVPREVVTGNPNAGDCTADADCPSGKTCWHNSGRHFDKVATAGVCAPASCQVSTAGQCGSPTDPCGRCEGTPKPCTSDAACVAGEVCGAANGSAFDSPAGRFCWPVQCATIATAPGMCGDATSPCGVCDCSAECAEKTCGDDPHSACGICPSLCDDGEQCEADIDCPAGLVCGFGIGDRYGLPAGSNACWKPYCATQNSELGPVPADCGTPTACTPDCSNGRAWDGCGGFCLALGPNQLRGEDGFPYTPIPYIPRDGSLFELPLPVQDTGEVGTVAGTFRVSDRGTATYTIPIEVPPGRGGLQPNLALKYLGSRADGMLGVGWGLTGLSTITRCRSTRAQPPYSLRPVMLDDQDRFCLDGEMLIQVNASSGAQYGADGAEYVLEKDTTVLRITSHGEGGLRTAYFSAIDRDGRKLQYGKVDSFVTASTGVRRVWALDTMEDSAQNLMKVSYYRNQTQGSEPDLTSGDDVDTGELLPRVISYGGSTVDSGDLLAQMSSRWVVFKYDERQDPAHHYTAGELGFSNWRLRSIYTRAEGTKVKTYKINYHTPLPSTTPQPGSYPPWRLGQVSAISECAIGNTVRNGTPLNNVEVCKPATTFEYLTTGSAYLEAHELVSAMPSPNISLNDPFALDVNGDGRDDIGYAKVCGDGVGCYDASQPRSNLGLHVSNWFGTDPAEASATFVPPSLPVYEQCFSPSLVIDINRDGRDDLVSSCRQSQSSKIFLSQEVSGTPVWAPGGTFSHRLSDKAMLGDLDGDGLKDFVACSQSGIDLHRNGGAGFEPTPWQSVPNPMACATLTLFDVDGDGDDDLVGANQTGIKAWRAEEMVWEQLSSDSFNPIYGAFLDLNGDGLKDRFEEQGRQIVLHMNTGKRFEATLPNVTDISGLTIPYTGFNAANSAIFDIDGDGSEDLVHVRKLNLNEFAIYIQRLVSRNHVEVWRTVHDFDSTATMPVPVAADLNGDGSRELVYVGGGKILFDSQGAGFGGLLRSVQDGLRRVDEVEYRAGYLHPSLSHPEQTYFTKTYSPDTCLGSNSLTCLRRVAPLVSHHRSKQVWAEREKPGAETLFRYAGAVVESGGHGWFGFKQRSVHIKGLSESTTDFNVDSFRTAGLPVRIQTLRYSEADAYSLTEFRKDVTDFNWVTYNGQSSQPDVPRFPFLQLRTDTAFSNDAFFSRTQTLFGQDEFNNVRESSTTVITPEEVISISHVLSPRLNNVYGQRVGLLDYVQIESTRGGDTQQRHTDFDYDERGLLTTTIRQPDDPTLPVYQRTDRTPNDFGVVDHVCVTTSDGVAEQRCSSIELDARSIHPTAITELGESLTTEVVYGPEAGQLLAQTQPNGVLSEVAYDAFGRESFVQSTEKRGAIAYLSPGAPQPTVFESETWGAMTVATNFREEGPASTTYDAFGRPVRSQHIGLTETTVVSESFYDALGRVVAASLPHADGSANQGLRLFGYDTDGELKSVTEPDGTETKSRTIHFGNVHPNYDAWFQDFDGVEATVVTLPRGNRKVSVRDYAGNVVRTFDDPDSLSEDETLTTRFDHGPFDLLRLVTTPKDFTQLVPDAIGRLQVINSNVAGIRARAYSGFDEVVQELDGNGGHSFFHYDRAGRLTEQLEEGGGVIAKWEYDGAEGRGLGLPFRAFRRASPSSTTGTWTEYEYEDGAYARPVATHQRIGANENSPSSGGEVFTTSVTYDLAVPARVDSVSYPDAGGSFRIQHTYDAGGHLSKVHPFGDESSAYWRLSTADHGVRPKREVFGNGVDTTRAYHHVGDQDPACLDAAQSCIPGSLAEIWTKNITSGSTLQYAALGSDRNGNVSWMRESIANTSTRKFTHDGFDRLVQEDVASVNGNSTVKTYTYDALGNLEAQSGLPQYEYGGYTQQLLAVGDTEYEYDANGNQIQRTGPLVADEYQQLNLNELELPWKITQGVGNVAHDIFFEYNADEQRVVKREEVAGGARVTVSVGDLYERVTKPGGIVEHHYKIYAGGRQIAELVRDAPGEEGDLTYLHTDHLGSPRVLTDADGESIESREFDLFGKPPGPWNSTDVNAGFTGHSHDSSLGLINMKGRLYDPIVGRFISADPFVSNSMSALGWDRYAYVEGNPLAFVDPSVFQTDYPVETGQRSIAGITKTAPPSPRSATASPANPLGYGTYESNPQGTAAGGSGQGNTNPTTATPAGGAGNPSGGPTSMGPTSGPPGSGPSMGQPTLAAPRSWIDNVQDSLDAASIGMDLTGVGGAFSWIPDLLNAGISGTRGDWVGVGLSLMAAVPLVGATANVGRIGRSANSAAKGGGKLVPWSSKRVGDAAEAMQRGISEVTVKGRDEAGEVFLGLFHGKGFKDTTGMTGRQVREQMGSKAGTYHWDVLDTMHGGRPHLQVHDEAGNIFRIFY